MAGMLQQLHDAASDVAAGQLEQSVDDLFGRPIAYNNLADFDINLYSVNYYNISGGS